MANIVKSVEFFDFTLPNTTASGTLTKSQTVANCVPFMSARGTSSTIQAHFMDAYFSSAGGNDYINVERSNSGGTQYCKVYVVEFDPNEVKVQQGSFSLNGVSNVSVTISGVDLTKTALSMYHKATTTTATASSNMVRGKFTDSSTIEFRRNATSQNPTGHYFVFEALNNQFSVEQVDWSTGTSTDATFEDSLSFVKGLVLSSYYSDYNASAPSYHYAYTYQWSRKDVRIYKPGSSSTVYGTSFFINFNDDRRHTQQYYAHFGTSDTTLQYDLVHTVDLSSSMSMCDNFQGVVTANSTNSTYTHNAFCSVELLTASGVEIRKGNTGVESYGYVQILDWNGIEIPVGTNSNPLSSAVSCAKSVENVSLELTDRTLYTDYVLTKGQTIDNCVPFTSSRSSSNAFDDNRYNVWFESPSLLCVQRGGLSTSTRVHVNVTEFYSDQVEVNTGQIYISGNYDTKVIEPVVENKTALIFYGSDNKSGMANASLVRGKFTSSSGIEFYRYATTDEWIGTYYTFEDLSSNFEVEQHSGSFTTSSRDFSDMELVPNTTFLIGSYTSNYNGTAPSYVQSRLTYQSTHAVGFNKAGSSSTAYYTMFIVKFIDGREHVQNIYQAFGTSDATKTQDLYEDFSGHEDSIIVYSNTCPGSTVGTTNTSYLKYGWCTIELLSNETIEMKLYDTSGTTVASAFSLIDWVGYRAALPAKPRPHNMVRSIEVLTFTLTGNEYQQTKYVTKGQDLNNCVPFYTLKSASANANTYESMVAALTFPEEGIVGACRGQYTSGMGQIDMTVNLIEFNSECIRVQQDDFYLHDTSIDISIDEVDLKHAFVMVSYYGYGIGNTYSNSFLEASFTDSTTLTLHRYTSDAGALMGRYYIIEALNEEFYVQTIQGSSSSTTTTVAYPEYTPNVGKTMFIGSIRSSYNGNAPSYGCTIVYSDLNHILINKSSGSGTIYYTVFAVEFNKLLDISIRQHKVYFGSSDTHKEVSINEVDEERAAVIASTHSINSTVGTTSAAYFPVAFSEATITTSGTLLEIDKLYSGAASNTFVHIVEFPEFNKYYFYGTVTEQGSPAPGRIVRAYRKDTGYLVDETTSASGTGYFYLETTYSGTHDIVCLDDMGGYSYNDLIYGDVIPTTISGL